MISWGYISGKSWALLKILGPVCGPGRPFFLSSGLFEGELAFRGWLYSVCSSASGGLMFQVEG